LPSGARPVSHQRRHATAVTATAAATSRGSARIGSSILRHPTAARRSVWRSSGRPPSRTFGPTAVGGMHTTAHATARRSPTYIIRATLVPRSDSPPARVTAGIRAVATRSRDWPRTAGTPGKPPRSTPAPASTGIPPRANVTARVPPDRSPSRIDRGESPVTRARDARPPAAAVRDRFDPRDTAGDAPVPRRDIPAEAQDVEAADRREAAHLLRQDPPTAHRNVGAELLEVGRARSRTPGNGREERHADHRREHDASQRRETSRGQCVAVDMPPNGWVPTMRRGRRPSSPSPLPSSLRPGPSGTPRPARPRGTS